MPKLLIATLLTWLFVLGFAAVAGAFPEKVRDYRDCAVAQRYYLEGTSGLYSKANVVVPVDATLVSARAEGNCVIARFYHSSFDLVPPGGSVPVVDLQYTMATPDQQEFWTVAQQGYMTYLKKLYGW